MYSSSAQSRFADTEIVRVGGPAPPSQSSAQAVEIAGAMVRCIVAAETYRMSGQLPEWARQAR